jgi:hypothetical protein
MSDARLVSVPADVPLYADVAHPDQPPEDQRYLLDMLDRLLGCACRSPS